MVSRFKAAALSPAMLPSHLLAILLNSLFLSCNILNSRGFKDLR